MVKETLIQLGRSTANALYPNEFEYYLCAFELIDSAGVTVDYFVFPVMPNNIRRSENKVKSIKKTYGGMVVTKTSSFVPIEYQLSGTFGRSIKVMIGGSSLELGNGISQSTIAGHFKKVARGEISIPTLILNAKVKTGYGVTKVFQAIMDKADGLDSFGNPYTLGFYNLAFGESYAIEIKNPSFTQDEGQSNMIWRYSVGFTAVSPLTQRSGSGVKSLLKSKQFAFGVSSIASNLLTKTVSNLLDQSLQRYG